MNTTTSRLNPAKIKSVIKKVEGVNNKILITSLNPENKHIIHNHKQLTKDNNLKKEIHNDNKITLINSKKNIIFNPSILNTSRNNISTKMNLNLQKNRPTNLNGGISSLKTSQNLINIKSRLKIVIMFKLN